MTKWLSVEQIANNFGLSRRTIFRWIEKGKIPMPVKIGGVLRFKESDILEWIELSRKGEKK